MSRYLLAITVGPIQEFISAARRTRDLWFGSYLLSEISKAVAKKLGEMSGVDRLIFPAPENLSELDPGSDLNVANIILADVLESTKLEDIVTFARKAAQERWLEFAHEAFSKASEFIEERVWKSQLDGVVEFYAAWVRYDTDKDYPAARRRVMRILAARKSCRDFEQDSTSMQRPKSSLDGARDSVLKKLDSKDYIEKRRKAICLADGEHLDVVGMTKRIGGGLRSYPSTCRIALDPWIRAARLCSLGGKINLDGLRSVCAAISDEKKLARLDEVRWPQYQDFPFDGSVLLPNPYRDIYRETGIDFSKINGLPEKIEKIRKELGKEPQPYLAVLFADGDRIGKTISAISPADMHQKFSQTLSRFAGIAKGLVQEYQGGLVYSGGDDVLALLPVDTCIHCARALHDAFSTLMQDQNKDKHGPPTLSVGISIGHFMEPLEDLLTWGRDAEKAAKKPDRNGLAIHWYTRKGSMISVRSQWSSKFYERMLLWVDSFSKGCIPRQIIYDLRRLALEYRQWPHDNDTVRAIRHDLVRLLKKKRRREGVGKVDWSALISDIQAALDAGMDEDKEPRFYYGGIMRLSNEWWIAGRLSGAINFMCGKAAVQGVMNEEKAS
jgi:CRISPR-associated protein Cmr2